MRKVKYSIFFSEIATKASIFLTDTEVKWDNYIGVDKALKVNPFTEGLNSNSGLDAVRNSEFSKFPGNVEKMDSPIVLTDVTCFIF